MTLRQLCYIDMITKRGTLTVVAETLFVTQPSLVAVLRELEQELGIAPFLRSRKGLSLTSAGEEFLGYAYQILDQVPLVERRYTDGARGYRRLCVSSRHYSFAAEASMALLNAYGGSQYEFYMRKIETCRIPEDVVKVRSEIGIPYRNQFNAAVLRRDFQEMKPSLTPICRAKPHVFLGTQHPFTKRTEISMEDLRDYPRLSHEQRQHNSFYFPEEIQSAAGSDKDIVICDRVALFNPSVGMDGYTICSGAISTKLNGKDTVVHPLVVDDYMELGYVLPKEHPTSDLVLAYTDLLRQFVR